MNAKQRMYARIEKHGNDLNAIFNTGLDPVTLCKKLHRLEAKAHRIATDQCNGVAADNSDEEVVRILRTVANTLGGKVEGLQFNGDCRGYALKISSEVMKAKGLAMYSDWGGYGILSPDFDGKP
jgi:hypothetical protein